MYSPCSELENWFNNLSQLLLRFEIEYNLIVPIYSVLNTYNIHSHGVLWKNLSNDYLQARRNICLPK